MPVNVTWYLEDYVVFWDIIGDRDADDLVQANQAVIDLLDASQQEKVHIIFNFAEGKVGSMVTNPRQVEQMFSFRKHVRLGTMCIYGNRSRAYNALVQLIGNLVGYSVQMFNSLPEAVTYLQSTDESLPPLPTEPPTPQG